MGNSCIQAKRRYIPQPETVRRKNRLKTRFLNKYKRQGIVKGKIQNLARVADIENTAQGMRRGLKNALVQKAFQIKLWHSISRHMLEHCTVLGTHTTLYSQNAMQSNNYSLS